MIIKSEEAVHTIINPLMARKVLGCGGSLMMVEVRFKKGGIGEPHSHGEHEQVSYIVDGSFEVTVGDKALILKKGDSFYAGKNVVHGVIAMEDAVILDIFTPIREDFLQV